MLNTTNERWQACRLSPWRATSSSTGAARPATWHPTLLATSTRRPLSARPTGSSWPPLRRPRSAWRRRRRRRRHWGHPPLYPRPRPRPPSCQARVHCHSYLHMVLSCVGCAQTEYCVHNAAVAAAAAAGDSLRSPMQPHPMRAPRRATHVCLAACTQVSLHRRARLTGSRSTGGSRSISWRAQSPTRSRPRRRRAKCPLRGGAWVRFSDAFAHDPLSVVLRYQPLSPA